MTHARAARMPAGVLCQHPLHWQLSGSLALELSPSLQQPSTITSPVSLDPSPSSPYPHSPPHSLNPSRHFSLHQPAASHFECITPSMHSSHIASSLTPRASLHPTPTSVHPISHSQPPSGARITTPPHSIQRTASLTITRLPSLPLAPKLFLLLFGSPPHLTLTTPISL